MGSDNGGLDAIGRLLLLRLRLLLRPRVKLALRQRVIKAIGQVQAN